MDITSFLSFDKNWKSPGNDQIQITGIKHYQLPTSILQKTSVQ